MLNNRKLRNVIGAVLVASLVFALSGVTATAQTLLRGDDVTISQQANCDTCCEHDKVGIDEQSLPCIFGHNWQHSSSGTDSELNVVNGQWVIRQRYVLTEVCSRCFRVRTTHGPWSPWSPH